MGTASVFFNYEKGPSILDSQLKYFIANLLGDS
jgi:hypothetical protein